MNSKETSSSNSNLVTLASIIEACTNEHPAIREKGWKTLVNRYKSYLYSVVFHYRARCRRSKDAEWEQKFADDVVCEVFCLLCQDGGKLLRAFQAVDNERSFRGYLATITVRAAQRLSARENKVHPEEYLESSESISNFPRQRELYEQLVAWLRSHVSRKEKDAESRILMFTMYLLGDFSTQMLARHPVFKHLGHRVLDNTMNRLKAKLLKVIPEKNFLKIDT